MKNQTWLLLLLTAMLPCLAAAQVKKCLTYESLQAFQSSNPNAQTDVQFEGWLKQAVKANAKNGTILSNYTIPIIFHIVHNGEPVGVGANLSAVQIQQQIAQLNADFANASGSRYGVAANANIRFELAMMDPQGRKLAEPGIERINRNDRGWQAPPYDVSTYSSFPDVHILPNTIWNPYAYFNVWVMDIDGIILGRSTFPSATGLNGLYANSGETDQNAGVLLQYKSVGSKSAPGVNSTWGGLGRTLTHEAGHFFGLRHIWGDADCGDDYCNDTPTQKDATTDCPGTVTISGCDGSLNRMYENYMDYTLDACVNTFTTEQVARMQAVMLNSPRRKELAQSAVYVAPTAHSIRFAEASFLFAEDAVVTAVCPSYRDVTVDINVFDAATGDATLHFTNSGNAVKGLDYELLTPTLTFKAGDATQKLLLRIWDDGVAEGAENIVLSYSISGSGVVAANENQTLSITVNDNDQVAALTGNGLTYLFKENFDGNNGSGANAWSMTFFGSQAQINRWVISGNGGAGITGNCAHITNNSVGANQYTLTSAADVALITKQINAKGISNVSLSFKYKSVGEVSNGNPLDYGSLVISYDGQNWYSLPNPDDDYNDFALHSTPGATRLNVNIGDFVNDEVFYLGFRWVNNGSAGAAPGFTIDDIEITGTALAVGQLVGTSGRQSVFAGQQVLLKNSNNTQLIAKIEAATTGLGCVTATITQAGTGLATITTDAGTYQRTQKVIQITPEAASKATVTLYFTTAELAAWGSSKGVLKVLKVKDGVDLNGTLSAKDAELITPEAVTEYAAEGYTAYTFTINTFSQFMLVSPTFTLPVRLVQFEANPADKQVQLTWLTADEKENKGFWVERSEDGTRFQQLGWVDAKGASYYNYTDHFVQPEVVYYYRLQQVDVSGRLTYSPVRQAKVSGASVTLQVTPNPATHYVQVFIRGSQQPVTIQLYNAGGTLVGQWLNQSVFRSPLRIPVGHLPKGIYTMVALLPDGVKTQKIIKQ